MRSLQHGPPDLPDLDATGSQGREHSWTVQLQALTPIYKGGANPGGIDPGRPFRAGAIKGILRTWWRATSDLTDVHTLRSQEQALFGSAGLGRDEAPIASKVRVGVTGQASQPAGKPQGSAIETYLLWMSSPGNRGEDERPFHAAGASGTLRISCPPQHVAPVGRALRAWLLLGGIGSRSRRGLGAVDDSGGALLDLQDRDALTEAFHDLRPTGGKRSWPTLAGARLLVGPRFDTADAAWQEAAEAMMAVRSFRRPDIDPYRPANVTAKLQDPPCWHDEDYANFRAGATFTSGRAALGLPIQFRSNDGAGGHTWWLKPARANRYPSPVLLRPVRTRRGFFPVMTVLTAPLPDGGQVKATGGVPTSGRIDLAGLDLYCRSVARIDGWSLVADGGAT